MSKQPKKIEPKDAKPEPKPKTAKKPVGQAASATGPSRVSAPVKAQAATKKLPTKAESKPARPSLLMGGIDTNLAASAAANLLVARRKGRDQITDPISIDQIKSDLAKPPAAVAGEVLDQHAESTGGRRPNLPGGPSKHNQTIGNAAERTFVPRRTAG